MAGLEWKEEYSVGEPELDDQHRRFMELINRFSAEASERPDLRFLLTTMESLINHAETHFSTEERLLRAAGYAKLAEQELEHISFTDEVNRLIERLEHGGAELRPAIERFLKDWYISHVVGSDQEYKGTLARVRK